MDELPPIHFVIISHNHYDHLDALAVEKLGNGPLWIVPKGHLKWFEGMGVTRVVEFDWWDELEITPELRVACLPAQHWSKRTLTDDNCALWSGWGVFGTKQRLFFAGDTGYCPGFQEIGKKFGPFDLSLIPIGAYDPRWFMWYGWKKSPKIRVERSLILFVVASSPQHVDPEEAVQIHVDIQSKKSIGMHWGTFILTDEPVLEPPVRVAADMKKRGLPDDEFVAIKHGEIVSVSAESSSSASSPSAKSTKKSKKSKKVKEVEETESSKSAATGTESEAAPKKKKKKAAAVAASSSDDN
jgi:N-acyl-phosphatidylethanolamine-hydrolysing phospholipase D